jgi:hypothetical protein
MSSVTAFCRLLTAWRTSIFDWQSVDDAAPAISAADERVCVESAEWFVASPRGEARSLVLGYARLSPPRARGPEGSRRSPRHALTSDTRIVPTLG